MKAQLDEFGREVLDQTPRAVPVKFQTRTHAEQMREIIRQELSRYAESQAQETFEEADDFDIGDDYDPSSPYEMHFDPLETGTGAFEDERPIDQQSSAKAPQKDEPAHRADAPADPVKDD